MNFKPEPSFDLTVFSQANLERCDSALGFYIPDMSPFYWASALSEEAGEVVGAVRKKARGYNVREQKKLLAKLYKNQNPPPYTEQLKIWEEAKTRDIKEEAADLFIQLNLFCQKMDIDLWQAVKDKFNKVSDEMNYPTKIYDK